MKITTTILFFYSRLPHLFFLVCCILLEATAAFSASVSYTYDVRHRLTGAAYDNGVTVQFTYDARGNRTTSTTVAPSSHVYEDAEDGDISGWDIYDNDPAGATIANVFDADRGSNVIEFTGSGIDNSYRLRNNDGTYWHDMVFKVFEWSMKMNSPFIIYVTVQTRDGLRYLCYTSTSFNNPDPTTCIHHTLGAQVQEGEWQTFIRDLEYDLKEAQPDNELQAVLGFIVRGSGRVDDIKTRMDIPATQDSDGDGINDSNEMTIYGTHPYNPDSDGDGINDGAELAFWGANWNVDSDGDGIIQLLDSDSDNDGCLDGMEIIQGTDLGDPVSLPPPEDPVGTTSQTGLSAMLYLLLRAPADPVIINPGP